MKVFDTFLFSFAILTLLIGIHQSMMHGYPASYWLFMLAGGSLLWYQVRKKDRKEAEKKQEQEIKTQERPQKKRKYKL